MHHIFKDRFLFVYIPFDCLVEFESLAQFQIDHLSHPVVPRFVFVFFLSLLLLSIKFILFLLSLILLLTFGVVSFQIVK